MGRKHDGRAEAGAKNSQSNVVSLDEPSAANSSPLPFASSARHSQIQSLSRRLADEFLYPVLSGVPLETLTLFFRQFAALVKAGIPLAQALALREGQTTNRRLQAVLRNARARVESGEKLSDAFAENVGVFDALQIAMIRAGEESGTLAEMLLRIADYLEQEMAFRRLVGRLTLYSKIIFVVGLFVIPAMFGFVMGGNPLAIILQPLLSLLAFGLLAFAAVAFCRLSLFRSEAAREGYERLKGRLPGIGAAARKFALAKFGRAFAALYAAGLPLPAALRIAGAASGSRLLASAAERAACNVERGRSLSDAFRAADAFPPVVLQMLHTGETTGDIDAMMGKVAEHLEAEAETKAHQAAYVFSNALYLLVAVYVVLLPLLSVAGIFGGR
jgi:type II secretory pathway component PulF